MVFHDGRASGFLRGHGLCAVISLSLCQNIPMQYFIVHCIGWQWWGRGSYFSVLWILRTVRRIFACLVLSELLRKPRKRGLYVVDQSTTIWKEVAAFGFHEITLTRSEAKVGLLGEGRTPQRPDNQPFLWRKKDFMLSRLLWQPQTALTHCI